MLEFSRFHGHVVDPDRGDHYPDDGEEAASRAVDQGTEGRAHGHAPDQNRQQKRKDHGRGRGIMPLGATHRQHVKKGKKRNTGQQRGKKRAPGGVVNLRPGHICSFNGYMLSISCLNRTHAKDDPVCTKAPEHLPQYIHWISFALIRCGAGASAAGERMSHTDKVNIADHG